MRRLIKSKIHKATVTEADLDYEGSISIDPSLMNLVDIWEGEEVLVVDNINGARLWTYAIPGKSGQICVNGAAAHLIKKGDEVIVMAFAVTDRPIDARKILVNTQNKMLRKLQ